jgi:F-type H+-transporting ATPase subunit c
MRFLSAAVVLAVAFFIGADPALAEEAAQQAGMPMSFGLTIVGVGLAAFGGALGQGKIMSSAVDAIGRNPGASGNIQNPALIGCAFVESLVLLVWLMILIKG